MNEVWTSIEEQFIRDNAAVLTDQEGAIQLGQVMGRPISTYAFRKKRQKLGLKKAHGRGVCRLVGQIGE